MNDKEKDLQEVNSPPPQSTYSFVQMRSRMLNSGLWQVRLRPPTVRFLKERMHHAGSIVSHFPLGSDLPTCPRGGNSNGRNRLLTDVEKLSENGQ